MGGEEVAEGRSRVGNAGQGIGGVVEAIIHFETEGLRVWEGMVGSSGEFVAG